MPWFFPPHFSFIVSAPEFSRSFLFAAANGRRLNHLLSQRAFFGFFNWFAVVADAGGSEKKFHNFSCALCLLLFDVGRSFCDDSSYVHFHN
jgi:hypothetical protein